MPKAGKENKDQDGHETHLVLSGNQTELKSKTTFLSIKGRGEAVKELEVKWGNVDQSFPSKRGDVLASLLKMTPNVVKLTLKFSGPLHNYKNCLGDKLLGVLCSMKHIEEFRHERTTCARTDFGAYTVLKLASSWPHLKHLYISGDTTGYGIEALPAATCPLVSATFERFMGGYSDLAPLLAGAGETFQRLEIWALGSGEFEDFITAALPSLRKLRMGGMNGLTAEFVRGKLARAPHLEDVHIGGDTDSEGSLRRAFAEALADEQAFPALQYFGYPAMVGTYKTGRGPNVRVHKHENPWEDELVAATQKRRIRAYPGEELEYKVEGAQRRAGIAALHRGYRR